MPPNYLLIQKISIYTISIPLKEPFITSLGKEEESHSIIVVIDTTNGLRGFGECNPFLPVNGESVETCMVVAKYFANKLINKNPLDIEGCLNMLDKIIYGNTSIKSAFDMALFDIASQHANMPLFQFLGGENNKELFTDYTVSLNNSNQMAIDALKIKQNGFKVIKVKLGGGGKNDVERIKAIRQAVGFNISICIDANQGWEVDEAIETLQSLHSYQIEHCEEPISRKKILDLPKIKKHSPIPIMADECCGDEQDALNLITLNACNLFNVKIGKCGGLLKGLKIIRIAENANIKMQIGAYMETVLGMTAFAHFALSSSLIEYVDLDTAMMHISNPISGGIKYAPNGKITLPTTIGLGAWVEPEVLNQCKIKIIIH